MNVFKYHVSCTDRKISVRIKIGITFIFRFRRRPIQLVLFVPMYLSSICGLLLQVLLGIDRRNFNTQQDLQKKSTN